jgi:hypothetical protein
MPFILVVLLWVEVAAGSPVEDFCRRVSRHHLEVEVARLEEHSGRLLAAALVV